MQMTIGDIEKKLKIEYATASALVKLMEMTGAAHAVGKRPPLSGKGKPSTIYEVPTTFSINLTMPLAVEEDSDQVHDQGPPVEVHCTPIVPDDQIEVPSPVEPATPPASPVTEPEPAPEVVPAPEVAPVEPATEAA